MLILGQNELGPINFEEYMYISVTLVCSIFFVVNIFGGITTEIETLGQESNTYQEKLADMNSAMTGIELDESIKQDVR